MATADGPTQNYGDDYERQWLARPVLAWFLGTGLWILPVLASVSVILVAALTVPPGSVGLGEVAWWLLFGALAAAVLIGVDRLARTKAPIVALLRMTLVFPDRAPSRFGVALRSGTVNRLTENGEGAATELVDLIRSVGDHDRLTRGHSERVRAYSDLIGEGLGLGEFERRRLSWARSCTMSASSMWLQKF